MTTATVIHDKDYQPQHLDKDACSRTTTAICGVGESFAEFGKPNTSGIMSTASVGFPLSLVISFLSVMQGRQ